VTGEPGQQYEIRFQLSARRLPEAVAAAVLEFCDAALAVSPHRTGKPLFGPLAGCHAARRGTHRIDENSRIVNVLDKDHRPEIYGRRQR
jgi:mRNA interferase RelE/StbE